MKKKLTQKQEIERLKAELEICDLIIREHNKTIMQLWELWDDINRIWLFNEDAGFKRKYNRLKKKVQ